jgi:hypothetical protein
MPLDSSLSRLPHLPPPVLTAYLDVNPGNPRNQGAPRGYVTWLTSTGQALGKQMSARDRKLFRRQLKRVDLHLRTGRPRSRSLAVFAGPKVWQTIPLQVEVAEELHWGKPSLQQMLWVVDEHRPRGVVVVESSKARFFHLWLGTIAEDKAAAVSADAPAGRRKYLVGTSHPDVFKRHGAQRDRAEDQKAAQRRRFAHELAQRIVSWSEERRISPIILAGSNDVVDATVEAMSADFRERIAVVRKALPRISPSEVKAKLGPALRRWEREYEASLVETLISARGANTAAIGLDRVLAELQNGRVRELIVARGMTGSLRQCLKCGRIDRSADPVCPVCGGKRRTRTLRTVIPELASLHAVPVEIVAGKAAERLRAAGGVGAWLRSAKASARTADKSATRAVGAVAAV